LTNEGLVRGEVFDQLQNSYQIEHSYPQVSLCLWQTCYKIQLGKAGYIYIALKNIASTLNKHGVSNLEQDI